MNIMTKLNIKTDIYTWHDIGLTRGGFLIKKIKLKKI